MTSKVDIFKSFKQLNSLDLDFWEKLSSDEKKQVSPLVFTMWMQNSENDGQVLYLNEFINPYLFSSLKDRHDIAFTLLSLSSRGKQNRYSWVKRKSNKESSKIQNISKIIKEYFDVSERQVEYYLNGISASEFLEICNELGIQDDEKKKLKKEFDQFKS